MKAVATSFFILIVSFSSTSALARLKPPEPYAYSYKVMKSGGIDVSSVCDQYGGIDWKNCRRYAQWQFENQCRELTLRLPRELGGRRAKLQAKQRFFCNASRRTSAFR